MEIRQDYASIFRGSIRGRLHESRFEWVRRTVAALGLERPTVYEYSAADVFWLTLGRCGRVERLEHKGFDYRALLRLLAERFDVVAVRGLPARRLPLWCSFTVAVVARARGLT